MTKTKPFLSTCYGDPSATEVPPCCEAATNKLTFSTTSVLLLLDVPLSLSRGTIFRRQKNPRRGYRPKIAGILFVCNEPGRSIPYCARLRAPYLPEKYVGPLPPREVFGPPTSPRTMSAPYLPDKCVGPLPPREVCGPSTSPRST